MKSVIKVISLLFLSVLIFTTCDNSIGLGPKVNTEKPVIKTPDDAENGPGSFLQGSGNRIYLEVEQEFGIAKVYMEVEYIDIVTKEKTRKTVDAFYDENKKQWYVDLDTSGMEDGSIKAWVTAIDVDGNKSTTTDIVYFVKNLPPQIKINMPLVDDSNWDDDVFLDDLKYSDPLFLGFELMGLATDNYGIEEGYPKIMIWPADYPYVDADGIPLEDDGLYGTWRSLVVPNAKSGLTATKFSWPMMVLVPDANAPGGHRLPKKDEPNNSLNQGIYRIRILTKDLFENENYYPNRKDNKRGPNGQAMNWEEIPRKYIEINYKASDVPIVQVTDGPQYSNTEKDFELYFSVSSQNNVDFTEAFIVDGNSGYEKVIGGPYTPAFIDSNGALYKYKLTITSAQAKAWTNIPEKGLIYARLRGAAGEKTGPNAYHNFIYDIDPPEVIIDRPVSLTVKDYGIASGTLNGGSYAIVYPDRSKPKWVTGTITFGGTAKDAYPLKEVYFHIGKLNEDKVSETERSAIYNNPDNWTNTNLHLNSPMSGWSGSPYSWTYTFSPFDKAYKDTPENIIEWPVQEYSELINGALEYNNYTLTDKKSRFYLPFYVKVTDSADNYRIIHYKLCVDPELDDPLITITQPEKGKDGKIPIVGGTVRIAGFAEDNFWMHTVLIRVKKSGDSGYYIPSTTPPITAFYPSNPNYPKPKKDNGDDDTDGWFIATPIGDSNNVNWYANINQDRYLDPSDSGNTQDVIVEVVAIDCDEADPSHKTHHIIGPIETWALKFSKDVPMITETKILKDNVAERKYAEGMKASGIFKFTFKVDAIEDINTLTARVNGASIPITLINQTNPDMKPEEAAVWSISNKNLIDGKAERTITVTVNSTSTPLIPGLGPLATGYPYGKTGELKLEIMAEDATENHLTTTNTFIIGIDNFYPTGIITTLNVASDKPDPDPAKAKSFYVSGRAYDSGNNTGNVMGLERVLVYFEKANITYPNGPDGVRMVTGRNNLYVRPNGGGNLGSSDFDFYPNILDISKGSGVAPNDFNFQWFPNHTEYTYAGETKWKSDVALVIDHNEGGGVSDSDGDGTQGETWDGQPAEMDFGARVNFAGWKDGPYMVHYIIMDKAGNASHYTKDFYLENNKPRITSINFGTNIKDNQADPVYMYSSNMTISEPSGGLVAGVLSPALRIRGNLFQVRLTVEKGNPSNKYTVTYVTEANTKDSPLAASSMKTGRVYTIVTQRPEGNTGDMTDFTRCGAPNNVEGTTFVATGPADGVGTVISYTDVVREPYTLSNTGGTIAFNNFSNSIPDSDKDINGNVSDHNKRYFIIKVIDTTVSSDNNGAPDPEYDQLADVMLVRVDIDNKDSKRPTINVLPFGKEYGLPSGGEIENDADKIEQAVSDYTKNINMSGTVKDGYVQYAADSTPTTTANISGKVKFLGKAEDNQHISGIYVTITGYNGGNGVGTQFQIANVVLGRITPVNPPENQAGQWAFKKLNDDYLTLEYGHALNWEFMWDSSRHSTITANNVVITFEIRDDANPTNLTNTSAVTVNVVPYITEVVTPLSKAYSSKPSAFNRSATGGYPVREGEEITIKGFNLGTFTGAGTVTNNVTIGGGTNYLTISTTNRSLNNIYINSIPTSVSSGDLEVKVNNIPSFNNFSNKSAAYNQEPNGVNNNVLTNARYLYVWSVGSIYTRSEMEYPFMRVSNSGRRFITYGTYATNGRLRLLNNHAAIDAAVATGAGSVHLDVDNTTNRYLNLSVAATNDTNDWIIASSNMTANQANWAMLHARAVTGTTGAQSTGTNKSRIISLGDATNQTPNRVRIPRLHARETSANTAPATANNNAMVAMSYGDETTTNYNIIFHYGIVSGAGTATFGGNFTAASGNAASTQQVVANGTTANDTTTRGSMYTAVATLSDGTPVIAWFDNSAQCLFISYGNRPTNNTSISTTITEAWTGRATVVQEGAGAHVDMAVDGDDNIHLAYNDISNGGLYYAYIPKTGITNAANDTTRTKVSNIETARVDTYLSAGTKLMINVRNEGTGGNKKYVPYITYLHASFYDTKNAVRVAWPVTAVNATGKMAIENGANEDDTFTGKWEVMTVPAMNAPLSTYFVCNGVPETTGGWTALTGTNALPTYSGGVNKTILVGYMTSSRYEGAMLKKTLW